MTRQVEGHPAIVGKLNGFSYRQLGRDIAGKCNLVPLEIRGILLAMNKAVNCSAMYELS